MVMGSGEIEQIGRSGLGTMGKNEGDGCDGDGEKRVQSGSLVSKKRTLMVMKKKKKPDVGGMSYHAPLIDARWFCVGPDRLGVLSGKVSCAYVMAIKG